MTTSCEQAKEYLQTLLKRQATINKRLEEAYECFKPNVKSSEGGSTVDHAGARKELEQALKNVNQQIAEAREQMEAICGDGGTFEVISEMDVF